MSVEKNIIADTQDVKEVRIDEMFQELDTKAMETCQKHDEIMCKFSSLNKQETYNLNNIISQYLPVETTV